MKSVQAYLMSFIALFPLREKMKWKIATKCNRLPKIIYSETFMPLKKTLMRQINWLLGAMVPQLSSLSAMLMQIWFMGLGKASNF
ncbi:unnamed protein product [Blepharisma stoltei]|uniref:Uncharacterized protein n=1 Tax=Blepharisma stoltei TaxID=1481888 RepID=A0AAU9IH69_9CILI|nr:unnamed protein product [Blepharisma stoltei]